jgi:subtilisin-like proprotein convertase family protein
MLGPSLKEIRMQRNRLGARNLWAGVLGALVCAAAAHGDFTGIQIKTRFVGTTRVHEVFAKFDGPTDTVVNVFNTRRIAGATSPVFKHDDTLGAGAGSWSPLFALDADDSFVMIGGESGLTSGNSTNADPEWGVDGFNQIGFPAATAGVLAAEGPGWFNSNPPNAQGRVAKDGRVKLGQFAMGKTATSVTMRMKIGYFDGTPGGTPLFAEPQFVLGCTGTDVDADGIKLSCDNCPTKSNATQTDLDLDSIGDACDNCSGAFNPSQENADADASGDACDNVFDKTVLGGLVANANNTGLSKTFTVPAGYFIGDQLSDVKVTFTGLLHTHVGDLRCELVAPDGTVATVFDRIGKTDSAVGTGDSSNFGAPGIYSFGDSLTGDIWAAAAAVGANTTVPKGTGFFASEALTGAQISMTNQLNAAVSMAGVWRIRVIDAVGGTALKGSFTKVKVSLTRAPLAGIWLPTPSGAAEPTDLAGESTDDWLDELEDSSVPASNE